MRAPEVAVRPMLTETGFVDGLAGRLFRVRSRPEPDVSPATSRVVLLIAPLAEEMNRSRRFLAALRRTLAERGACAEVIDPFGTGDSDGDFEHARWDVWRDDLIDAVRRSRAEFVVPVSLFGIRAGCLLAHEVARRLEPVAERIVQLQPELDGRLILQRWLRGKAAAERLAGASANAESVASLRARLANGQTLDLGGYRLGTGLAAALDELRLGLDESPPASGLSYRFSIVLPGTREALEPGAVDNPRDEGTPSELACVAADTNWLERHVPSRPFWQLADSSPDASVVTRIAASLAP